MLHFLKLDYSTTVLVHHAGIPWCYLFFSWPEHCTKSPIQYLFPTERAVWMQCHKLCSLTNVTQALKEWIIWPMPACCWYRQQNTGTVLTCVHYGNAMQANSTLLYAVRWCPSIQKICQPRRYFYVFTNWALLYLSSSPPSNEPTSSSPVPILLMSFIHQLPVK